MCVQTSVPAHTHLKAIKFSVKGRKFQWKRTNSINNDMIVSVLRNKQKLPGNGVISSPTETVKKGKTSLKTCISLKSHIYIQRWKWAKCFFYV